MTVTVVLSPVAVPALPEIVGVDLLMFELFAGVETVGLGAVVSYVNALLATLETLPTLSVDLAWTV